MFGNLGMGELIIIAAIALVVIGPEKFPEFAKIALRAYRDLRGYVDDIKHEMAEEMNPVKKELRELSKFKPEDYIDNVAKAVAAFDEPETKEEEHTASAEPEKKEEHPTESVEPPGDWSGGAHETPAHTETTSEHSEPAKDNIYG